MSDEVLKYYAKASSTLIPKYEAISSPDLYAPVSAFLPERPAKILDIGAGTGRDAAWFASLGHHVTAVEPVAPFQDAARLLHKGSAVWINDSLPHLSKIITTKGEFECILLCAVWHHLSDEQRSIAARTLAALLQKGGRLILSLRHDDTHDAIRQTDDLLVKMDQNGLAAVLTTLAASVQPDNHKAGVSWTWVVFEHKTDTLTPCAG